MKVQGLSKAILELPGSPEREGLFFLKNIIQIIDKVGTVSGVASGILLLAALVMVLVEIVLRTLFHGTVYITDEYSGYVMVGITFISLAYGIREKGHIRMVFLRNLLKNRGLAVLEIIVLLIGLCLMIVITYETFLFFWEAVVYKTQSMQVSKTYLAIPKLLMPLGCGMFAIQLGGEIFKCIQCIQENDYTALMSKEELDNRGS